jgi:hypothetical protein
MKERASNIVAAIHVIAELLPAGQEGSQFVELDNKVRIRIEGGLGG